MSTVVLWSILCISALLVLGAYLRGRVLFRGLAFNLFSGFAALAAVNAAGIVSGVSIALNAATLGIAACLGIPGVASILLLHLVTG